MWTFSDRSMELDAEFLQVFVSKKLTPGKPG